MIGLLKRLFALHIDSDEKLAALGDPCNIYSEAESKRGRQSISAALALLLHGLIFLIVLPSTGRQLTVSPPFVLARLAPPSGGSPAAKASQPEPVQASVPQSAKPKPIPMPYLKIPRPLIRQESLAAPQIQQMEWPESEFSIGTVLGPAALGQSGRNGDRMGRQSGRGPEDGEPVFQPGLGGVSLPVLLVQTLPGYTDSAIQARIQGTVLLRAVVRRDGSVDRVQVLRGLGHGLDERAIQEIANHWKFRPGLRAGQPVDVWATIEVSFTLR